MLILSDSLIWSLVVSTGSLVTVNENRAAVWVFQGMVVSKGGLAERTVGGSRLVQRSSRTEHVVKLGRAEAGQRKEPREVRKLGNLMFKGRDSVFRCKQLDVQFQLEMGRSRTVLVTRD